MFKKIDMFVFYATISFNVIGMILSVLFLAIYGVVDLDKIEDYGNIIFYIIIFFYKLKDKSFKIKYFLAYVIIAFMMGDAIGFMVRIFSVLRYTSKAGIREVVSFTLVATFLTCYLEGFLYQYFKKISYEKDKDNLIE
ncbi:hypothetical protein LIY46_07850 [Fusobacterium varium]|uniref:hypothetical protein n=1 Tax=Fusobacterium TaxID=848 RepID=UPI0030CE61E2